jgi:glutamine---fructose-6-phosphate transaminase (isomerizing)
MRRKIMCGIFGYVGERSDAAELVLKGLKKLEYRGYDSWGIAVAAAPQVVAVDKRVGKIGAAVTVLPASSLGIGHTRWATHGGVTSANAHPQLDCTGRLALVHNGIVTNHVELRHELQRAGHRLDSETDSELIAHLIEAALEPAIDDPEQLVRATMMAFRKLRGLNAFAVFDARTGALTAAKTGSPLVVGFADSGYLLASDQGALLEHTRRIAFVADGQAVYLSRGQALLYEIESGQPSDIEITTVEWEATSVELLGHPDFMTKETHEQPGILHKLATSPHRQVRVQELAACIEASSEVFLIGCGSAYHAALAAEHFFARAGRRVTAVTASEFLHVEPFVRSDALLLALSQSGETIDVLEAVRSVKARGTRVAALTNVEGSSLWRLADFTLPLDAGPERCVLATKSLTAKLAILFLTAQALRDRLTAGAEQIERASHEIAAMLHGPRRAAIYDIACSIQAQHLYVLGRGISHSIALETALKIKEVSYLHAEGFAGGELKHGVIALIESGSPCIVLVPNDDSQADMLAGAMQVKARGAHVIGIGSNACDVFDQFIEVADLGEVTAIVNAVPAQLLGYDLARLRGHDPDMPRNLAKSVTVK